MLYCMSNTHVSIWNTDHRRTCSDANTNLRGCDRSKLHYHLHRSLDCLNRSRGNSTSRPGGTNAETQTCGERISPSRRAHRPSIHSTSEPIRLPETHIHRTPSELQLEQDLIKADIRDRRMYSRLVNGMLLNNDEDEHSMHPLTAKSLKGLITTHHRGFSCHDFNHEHVPSSDSDWTLSFPQETAILWIDGTDSDDASKALDGASSLSDRDEEEDEFVFSA